MAYCKLQNVKVLFTIPKRGKGSQEVSASIDIYSSSDIEPEEFISFFIPYQKKVMTENILQEIGDNLVIYYNLLNLKISLSFTLYLDKLTPNLNESLSFPLLCKYVYEFENNTSYKTMSIICNVRVKKVSTLKGSLIFSVTEPNPHTYFEDLLDIVQKYGNVIIYPISKFSDNKLLIKEIDAGKEIDDYIKFIKVASIHKNISKRGRISISIEDIYSMYNIEKGEDWG